MEQIRDTRGELASFQHHCFDIIIPTPIIIIIIIGNCLKVSQQITLMDFTVTWIASAVIAPEKGVHLILFQMYNKEDYIYSVLVLNKNANLILMKPHQNPESK